MLRVAIAQMCSGDDLSVNLKVAAEFVREAASRGAKFIALPENFAYLRREGSPYPCAQGFDGEIVGMLSSLARELDVWLLGGSFPEAIKDSPRVFNTSALFDPSGECIARYRKLHLFDADLGAAGGAYRESDVIAPGEEIVVGDTPFGSVGLSICYDLRFPELFRAQVAQGARLLCVPAAFAPETGKDHWEVLLRSRAIENQVFVVASAQCGRHSLERASHGRSMIIDPWGLVIAHAGDRPGVIVADCDFAYQDSVRNAIPCLRNRRL